MFEEDRHIRIAYVTQHAAHCILCGMRHVLLLAFVAACAKSPEAPAETPTPAAKLPHVDYYTLGRT